MGVWLVGVEWGKSGGAGAPGPREGPVFYGSQVVGIGSVW